MDADTLLEEMAFQMPFSAYDGKNFIAWGNADYLWAGDQFHGPYADIDLRAIRPNPTAWMLSLLWPLTFFGAEVCAKVIYVLQGGICLLVAVRQ